MKRMKNTKKNQEKIKGNYKEFRFHIYTYYMQHETYNIHLQIQIHMHTYIFFQAKLTC